MPDLPRGLRSSGRDLKALAERLEELGRLVPQADSGESGAGQDDGVELGGLARTDNSGWGDEFERLTTKLLSAIEEAEPARRRGGSTRFTIVPPE